MGPNHPNLRLAEKSNWRLNSTSAYLSWDISHLLSSMLLTGLGFSYKTRKCNVGSQTLNSQVALLVSRSHMSLSYNRQPAQYYAGSISPDNPDHYQRGRPGVPACSFTLPCILLCHLPLLWIFSFTFSLKCFSPLILSLFYKQFKLKEVLFSVCAYVYLHVLAYVCLYM